MKKCPYCAEEILDDAIKCRFCKESLTKEDIKQKAIDKALENEKKNEGGIIEKIIYFIFIYAILKLGTEKLGDMENQIGVIIMLLPFIWSYPSKNVGAFISRFKHPFDYPWRIFISFILASYLWGLALLPPPEKALNNATQSVNTKM